MGFHYLHIVDFTDYTTTAGLGSISNDYGVAWGDYDIDGYPDLYVSTANSLYHERRRWNLLRGTVPDGQQPRCSLGGLRQRR